MVYSILIKNGTIIDGSGNIPYQGDIGIFDNYIKDIGEVGSLGDQADTIIDATNLCISPGFIDLTNHSDIYGTLFTVPGQDSLLTQGITSILVGNCGYSLAPIIKKEAADDLGRWTNVSSLNIDWSSISEYFDSLNRAGISINVATLIGQETLRKNTISIEEKKLLLSRSLKDGACGLSSNFSFVNFSEEVKQESVELLKVVKEYNGLWKIHIGDEGQNLLPAVASVIGFAKDAGVRTVISHFKAIGRKAWNEYKRAIKMINSSREQNVDISIDIFPYLRTGSLLLSLLPQWAREGDVATVMARLNDKKTSEFILQDLLLITLHPERIMIASAQREKTHVSKTLDDISRNIGLSPEATILEILRINNLNVTIFGKTLHSKNLIFGIMQENSFIATDGAGYDLSFATSKDLVHPRSFGAFARFFNKIGPLAGLPMEKIIQKMTSIPAKILGLKDRGLLSKNLVADIVIFHPEEFRDQSTYLNPYKFATGMRYVVIGGRVIFSNDTINKNIHGSILKRK
ncbi:MAG: hypothetical protein AAB795_02765 [Patescibacteria group bacterium]